MGWKHIQYRVWLKISNNVEILPSLYDFLSDSHEIRTNRLSWYVMVFRSNCGRLLQINAYVFFPSHLHILR